MRRKGQAGNRKGGRGAGKQPSDCLLASRICCQFGKFFLHVYTFICMLYTELQCIFLTLVLKQLFPHSLEECEHAVVNWFQWLLEKLPNFDK